MIETRNIETSKGEEQLRDQIVLVDRLIRRQGLSRDEALQMVDDYRQGKHPEIDPILMEGLDAL